MQAKFPWGCEGIDSHAGCNSGHQSVACIMFHANREFAQSQDCPAQTRNSSFAAQTWDCADRSEAPTSDAANYAASRLRCNHVASSSHCVTDEEPSSGTDRSSRSFAMKFLGSSGVARIGKLVGHK